MADDDGAFVVSVTLIVADIARSVAFCRDVLGATVRREGDKPEVIATPPKDPNALSGFSNLRVNSMATCYELWRSRGAKFITEPKVHATEIRRLYR
jgi:lactoylglutathione lyase